MNWWGSFYTDRRFDSSFSALILLNQSNAVTTVFVCFQEHGLFITELNPYISESYIRAYFQAWGTVTVCKVRTTQHLPVFVLVVTLSWPLYQVFHTSGMSTARAYVGFYMEDEANRAKCAGPHYIGGNVTVRRVVTQKVSFPLMWQDISHSGFIFFCIYEMDVSQIILEANGCRSIKKNLFVLSLCVRRRTTWRRRLGSLWGLHPNGPWATIINISGIKLICLHCTDN